MSILLLPAVSRPP